MHHPIAAPMVNDDDGLLNNQYPPLGSINNNHHSNNGSTQHNNTLNTSNNITKHSFNKINNYSDNSKDFRYNRFDNKNIFSKKRTTDLQHLPAFNNNNNNNGFVRTPQPSTYLQHLPTSSPSMLLPELNSQINQKFLPTTKINDNNVLMMKQAPSSLLKRSYVASPVLSDLLESNQSRVSNNNTDIRLNSVHQLNSITTTALKKIKRLAETTPLTIPPCHFQQSKDQNSTPPPLIVTNNSKHQPQSSSTGLLSSPPLSYPSSTELEEKLVSHFHNIMAPHNSGNLQVSPIHNNNNFTSSNSFSNNLTNNNINAHYLSSSSGNVQRNNDSCGNVRHNSDIVSNNLTSHTICKKISYNSNNTRDNNNNNSNSNCNSYNNSSNIASGILSPPPKKSIHLSPPFPYKDTNHITPSTSLYSQQPNSRNCSPGGPFYPPTTLPCSHPLKQYPPPLYHPKPHIFQPVLLTPPQQLQPPSPYISNFVYSQHQTIANTPPPALDTVVMETGYAARVNYDSTCFT